MATRRRVTLQEVAQQAGVDPSTASRALNRVGRLSPGTEERVRAAANRLGYVGPKGSATDAAAKPPPPNSAKEPAVTIYDVAREAGVSPSTVSRALQRPGRLNGQTESRVRAVAERLNYRQRPLTRQATNGRTFTVGLIVADFTNPMFFNLVRGAEGEAQAQRFTLVVAESRESSMLEAEAVERLISSVDGLVLATTRLQDSSIRELAARVPLVMVNRELDGVSSVVPEVDAGIAEALTHLSVLGHKTVAYMGGPTPSWMNFARGRAIAALAEDHGMTIRRIGPGAPTRSWGHSALPAVLTTGASAVIAYNDLMAIGVLGAAQQAGLRVPEDLSIIGFDDIFGADFTSPPLTTVRTPLGRLGAQAVRRTLDIIDGGSEDLLPEERPSTSLVIRGSTGRATDR